MDSMDSMDVQVKMLAFEEPDTIRTVHLEGITSESFQTDDDFLEAVFQFGQNIFQSQPCCSVSVGDVVIDQRTDTTRYWMVMGMGHKEITEEQLAEYEAIPREKRSMYAYGLKEEEVA